ncbi:hypothetical protein K1719_011093 [Acacia pycnantha]|nr:hypothetical protein K1719_011093 [Acacia pycnantha]
MALPVSYLRLHSNGSASHSHIPQTHRSIATLSPFTTLTSKSKPFCISFPNPSSSSITIHQRYHLFTSYDKDRLLSLSTTVPRKLLCKPPQGKFVREDYLVKKLSADEVQELNLKCLRWSMRTMQFDEYEFARDMQVRGLPILFFISSDPNKEAIRTEGLIIPIQMMRDIIDKEM